MKKSHLFFLFALGFLTLSSCSSKLTYFTEDLYQRQGWSQDDLKRIQFYISRDLVLKRELTGGKSEIISGKIKVEDGRKIETVVIPKGTPGAFIFSPKDNRFAISFEDNDERYLMFGPSPKYSDRFVLLAGEWQRNTGKVSYDNKTWNISSEDAYAALVVDLKKVSKVDVNSRTAKGRKVGGK